MEGVADFKKRESEDFVTLPSCERTGATEAARLVVPSDHVEGSGSLVLGKNSADRKVHGLYHSVGSQGYIHHDGWFSTGEGELSRRFWPSD